MFSMSELIREKHYKLGLFRMTERLVHSVGRRMHGTTTTGDDC